MTLDEQFIDTWRIHSRITLYLFDAISADAFNGVSASMGRSVGAMFAHLHNVRLIWLQQAAPELLDGLAKIEKEEIQNLENLRASLQKSAEAVERLLKNGLLVGKIKGFKPHPFGFLGYLIAHESYHHGEIGMTLTQSGHPLDKKIGYGMWEWGVR